jgi:hypothetical protein
MSADRGSNNPRIHFDQACSISRWRFWWPRWSPRSRNISVAVSWAHSRWPCWSTSARESRFNAIGSIRQCLPDLAKPAARAVSTLNRMRADAALEPSNDTHSECAWIPRMTESSYNHGAPKKAANLSVNSDLLRKARQMDVFAVLLANFGESVIPARGSAARIAALRNPSG